MLTLILVASLLFYGLRRYERERLRPKPVSEWAKFKGLGPAPESRTVLSIDDAALIQALRKRGYRGSERAPFPAARPRK